MTDNQFPKEFRLKNGSTILNYVKQFSATEKAIFGALIAIAVVTAIMMASKVNAYFTVQIPADNGSLTEGLVGLPHTVNPVLAVTDVDHDLSALIYSGLTKYENGTFVPDLAASTTISSDGLTYTFALKNNLYFQDKTPLTTADVAYTIQKIQDPALKSPLRADWKDVTIKIISPQVIQFILKQAYSPFISNTTVGIIPKHIWNDLTDDQFILSKYNIEAIGSGPFKENSIDKSSDGIPKSYKLSTWDNYYAKKPHLETITINFYADQEKALSALTSGAIDSLPSISSTDAAKLASDSGRSYTLVSAPLPRIFGVFFNQSQVPALSDINVRTALNMVVDRSGIVNGALNGYGEAVYGPLPSATIPIKPTSQSMSLGTILNTGNAGSASATTSMTKTIAAGKALLEKNGWKKDPQTGIYQYQKSGSKTVTVLAFDIYTADTPDLKQAAQLLKDSWTALGARVTVKVFEPSDLYQNVIRPRKYDALLFGEFVGSDRDLYAFWHSSERNYPGLNVALYANSKADKLLESIRTTIDDTSRAKQYDQFAQLVATDIPAIFLYVPDFIYAVPTNLHNVDLGTITVPSDRFNSITNWYNTTQNVWKIFAPRN